MGRIQCLGIGREVVVKGDILLKDDDHMSDRGRSVTGGGFLCLHRGGARDDGSWTRVRSHEDGARCAYDHCRADISSHLHTCFLLTAAVFGGVEDSPRRGEEYRACVTHALRDGEDRMSTQRVRGGSPYARGRAASGGRTPH